MVPSQSSPNQPVRDRLRENWERFRSGGPQNQPSAKQHARELISAKSSPAGRERVQSFLKAGPAGAGNLIRGRPRTTAGACKWLVTRLFFPELSR